MKKRNNIYVVLQITVYILYVIFFVCIKFIPMLIVIGRYSMCGGNARITTTMFIHEIRRITRNLRRVEAIKLEVSVLMELKIEAIGTYLS